MLLACFQKHFIGIILKCAGSARGTVARGSRVLLVFFGFLLPPKKHAIILIGYAKLALGANECVWRHAMDWCPSKCVFPHHSPQVPRIGSGFTDQGKAHTDEWILVKVKVHRQVLESDYKVLLDIK